MIVGVCITNVAAACNSSAGGWRYPNHPSFLTAFWWIGIQEYQTGIFKVVYPFTWGCPCFWFSRKSRNIPTCGQWLEKLHTVNACKPQRQDCVIPLDLRYENHLGMSMVKPLMFSLKCARRNDSWPIKITNCYNHSLACTRVWCWAKRLPDNNCSRLIQRSFESEQDEWTQVIFELEVTVVKMRSNL